MHIKNMGLDLECDNMEVRVGSYGSVQFVKTFLIDAIKNYIENSKDFFDNKDELLEKINESYTDYSIFDYLNLSDYGLNGFECFINHSDCDGHIGSYDASKFVRLCDKLNDYFDKNSHYFRNDKFFLYDIFVHSSKTGEDIFFC